MSIYFNEGLYIYSCKKKINDYCIIGKKGIISFQLKTPYFKKINLSLSLEYIFDIFTAYKSEYLGKTNVIDNKEYEKIPFPIDKKYTEALEISKEKIDMDYFQKRKGEGKDIIDLYVDLKFNKHSSIIFKTPGMTEEDEDSIAQEELGSKKEIPLAEGIEKELRKYNINSIYNITMPLSDPDFIEISILEISPYNFFKEIKNLFEANAQEILIPQPDYFEILKEISILGLKYNTDKTFSFDELNNLRKKINLFGSNPLVNLLKKLFLSFVKTIESRKDLLVCNLCGNIIEYRKGKKYCSYKSEGKDCGKSARNKRAYSRRKSLK